MTDSYDLPRTSLADGDGTSSRAASLLGPAFLVLGAVGMIVVWLGGMNPEFGALAKAWPWELFRGETGRPAFVWSPHHAFALVVPVLALLLLVAALLRPGRGRGIFVLTVIAIALCAFPPQTNRALVAFGGLLVGLLAAGIWVQARRPARGLVVAGLCLVLGYLFAPLPPMQQGSEPAPDIYASMAHLVMSPPDGADVGDLLLTPFAWGTGTAALLAVLGLLSLLGLRGRWSAGLGIILVVLFVLAQAILRFRDGYTQPSYGLEPFQAAVGFLGAMLGENNLALVLPLVAAIRDCGAPPPHADLPTAP